MQVEHVEPLQLQAPERGLARLNHVLTAPAEVVGARTDAAHTLGCDGDRPSAASAPATNDFLRPAPGLWSGWHRVDVCSVEKVDAQLAGPVHDGERRRLVQLASEDHRAEAQPAHAQSAPTDVDRLHRLTDWVVSPGKSEGAGLAWKKNPGALCPGPKYHDVDDLRHPQS